MSCLRRGEKVIWVSPLTGAKSKALFVAHDKQGFPKRDALLMIGLGAKGNKMPHIFRWPFRYIRRID